MASINLFLIVGVVTLPFVQNAPSNIVKTPSTEEDLRTRLVFIDRDDEVNNNIQIKASAVIPSPLSPPAVISSTRSKHLGKSAENIPTSKQNVPEPSILSQMDDDRRIWGIAVENTEIEEEDESYYNRPISLPRTIPKIPTPTRRRIVSEVQKVETRVDIPKPSDCDMSIVICCNNNINLKECFRSHRCINATEDMFPSLCSSDSINKIIQNLGRYYKGNEEK